LNLDLGPADLELERDIGKKVIFWIDCIKSWIPGAVIIVVGTFSDAFIQKEEVKRRWNFMKDQVYRHEENSLKILRQRLDEMQKLNEANIVKLRRVRRLLEPLARPKFAFEFFPPLVVSSLNYEGFDSLRTHIVGVATGRIPDEAGVLIFEVMLVHFFRRYECKFNNLLKGNEKKIEQWSNSIFLFRI